MKTEKEEELPALARRLSFLSLVFYGVGAILGAGIYALVGKVIDVTGTGAWLSFIFSALLALITGLSYAEMSARFPSAGGAVIFVKRAFPGQFMATLVGILVLGTGLTTTATVTVAFSDYFTQVWMIPKPIVQVLLVTALSFLSFWGIRESSWVNMICTAVEVAGLIAVIVVGVYLLQNVSIDVVRDRTLEHVDFISIFSGVTIAFFAFIGFEDLCNLAEEAKNPSRDLPRAILVSIAISTFLYVLVILALQMTIPTKTIIASPTPLLLLFETANAQWMLHSFAFIAMMAIGNTALINLIMASRLMYGMSHEQLLPKFFRQVHNTRKTPWLAAIVVYLFVLLLIFTGGLKILAQTTSFLIIVVFLSVHVSLLRTKWKHAKTSHFRIPFWVPCLGALTCIGLIIFFPFEVYLRSGLFFAIGSLLWFFQKRQTTTSTT